MNIIEASWFWTGIVLTSAITFCECSTIIPKSSVLIVLRAKFMYIAQSFVIHVWVSWNYIKLSKISSLLSEPDAILPTQTLISQSSAIRYFISFRIWKVIFKPSKAFLWPTLSWLIDCQWSKTNSSVIQFNIAPTWTSIFASHFSFHKLVFIHISTYCIRCWIFSYTKC